MLHLLADRNHDLAHAAMKRARSDNPNDIDVYEGMGFLRSMIGRARRRSSGTTRPPRYPGWCSFNAALSHRLIREYGQAELPARSDIAACQKASPLRRILIATLVETNRMEEARTGGGDPAACPAFGVSNFRGAPFLRGEDRVRCSGAMRAAGLPD